MPVSVVYGCGLQSRTMWALCWNLGDYPKGPGFLPLLLTMLVLDELVVPKPRTGSAAGRRLVRMLRTSSVITIDSQPVAKWWIVGPVSNVHTDQ